VQVQSSAICDKLNPEMTQKMSKWSAMSGSKFDHATPFYWRCERFWRFVTL